MGGSWGGVCRFSQFSHAFPEGSPGANFCAAGEAGGKKIILVEMFSRIQTLVFILLSPLWVSG